MFTILQVVDLASKLEVAMTRNLSKKQESLVLHSNHHTTGDKKKSKRHLLSNSSSSSLNQLHLVAVVLWRLADPAVKFKELQPQLRSMPHQVARVALPSELKGLYNM